MGITTLRRRHDDVVEVEQPSELETAVSDARDALDEARAALLTWSNEHSGDEVSEAEGLELSELESAVEGAEGALKFAELELEAERSAAAKPANSAKVAEWRAFAVEFAGISEADAQSLTKAQLQELVAE